MRRPLVWLVILLLAGLGTAGTRAATTTESKKEPSSAEQKKSTLPETAREGGYFQRGGTDIGRGYAHGGRELGRGTTGFGKELAKGQFGEAGRSFGRGTAGFGKGVGVGTARGFKNFGLAFRNLGKKVDRTASDDQDEKKSD